MGYIVIKIGMRPIDARTESLIETAERLLASRRQLERSKSLTLAQLRNWQAKATLDLRQFLWDGSAAIDAFKRQGRLLPTEYEMNETATYRALKRQIRSLEELIDRADRPQLDFSRSPHVTIKQKH
jgi:hypothetical protein